MLDPLRIPGRDVPASLHNLRQVELKILAGNSPLVGVLKLIVELGVFEKGFCGYASPVEADAPYLIFLYDSSGKAELGGANRGYVSARAASDNADVKLPIGHEGERWLVGMHINPFEKGNINNHDPKRERKLLMHKKEILRIMQKISEKGLTLVPLKIFFKKNLVKVEVGLARGKKSYDKREAVAK